MHRRAPEPEAARALTTASLGRASRSLARVDPALASILERWGPPPLWDREPGFATLLNIILEQQVSLASARAAMDRLVAAIGPPRPEPFLALDDGALFGIGFSRQKRDYARGLAAGILDGTLDLDALGRSSDSEARGRLMDVRGIGAWSADIYLLMALGRPDVWPRGDRALIVALRHAKGLAADPADEEAAGLAEAWRPWRSVAARLLWHLYLSEIRPRGGRSAE